MRYSDILDTPLGPALSLKPMEGFDKFWKEIEVNCSDIISLYKTHNRLLYRGMKRDGGIYFTKEQIRNDRKSLNTHNLKALRSNSLFVTGDSDLAQYYGQPFIIFPKNGFNYTWFKNARDLYDEIRWFNSSENNQMELTTDIQSNNFNNKIDQFMNFVKPTYTNIDDYIQVAYSGYELMVQGVEYYAVRTQGFERIIKTLLDMY